MESLDLFSPAAADLGQILKERFGFNGFRPYQEAVCQAVVEGRDTLLVMPTGAGKSLCYQLPGLARRGTTLVVSPLVALMEDQVQKLQSQGFRAERIHAGRAREEARAVCVAYLAGELDYLFFAPERLAVPGFPEMLARRGPPALIAIDEAHCISQWGHDFRPEYRMLAQRLPPLRPAPVIALTATATKAVQEDIIAQLGLEKPLRSIHGFRRDNIGIEVAELSPGARGAATVALLTPPERRPAIVYASTRKNAEALAGDLAEHFPTEAYHAGLSPERRDRTQSAFLKNELEVIVATVAFGMGIDKPNVRTVVHTALASSIEGYYQEIGRAGRDGLPSKAYLLWSYADRRTQEFLHGRNYPELSVLKQIVNETGPRPQAKSDIGKRLRLEEEIFEAALDKLWIFGGVTIDPEENVRLGKPGWERAYAAQREHRLQQVSLMNQFAEGTRCRMQSLLRHFGDVSDDGRPCGHCDICNPGQLQIAAWRDPDEAEESSLRRVLDALSERDSQAVGKIYRDHFEPFDRKTFEQYLNALARAGLLELTDETFEKDGRVIPYRVAHLTLAGRGVGSLKGSVRLPASPAQARGKKKKRAVLIKKAPVDGARSERRFEALRAWRLQEARRAQIPAFRILPDRTLHAIADAGPANNDELLEVAGMGPKLLQKYGGAILETLSRI